MPLIKNATICVAASLASLFIPSLLQQSLSAHAQTQTFCEADFSGLDFGNLNPVEQERAHTRGDVRIACHDMTGPIYACVMIPRSEGGGRGNLRSMQGPKDSVVSYSLYSDAGLSRDWGDAGVTQPGVPPLLVIEPTVASEASGSRLVPIYAAMTMRAGDVAPGTYRADLSGAVRLVASDQPIQDCRFAQGKRSSAGLVVKARVTAGCRMTATDLDFGTTGMLDKTIDAKSQLTVDCTRDTSFSIDLRNASGSGSNRLMRGVGGTVRYGLYLDHARSRPWTDAGNQYLGVGTGQSQKIAVHGRVPPQLAPPPGDYSDTITAIITY